MLKQKLGIIGIIGTSLSLLLLTGISFDNYAFAAQITITHQGEGSVDNIIYVCS